MKENLMENIQKFVEDNKAELKYSSGKNTFTVEIHEDVDINYIHSAIENVIENVEKQDFAYDLIDVMLPYYYISLFTDIPAPMTDEENVPDYEQCMKIAMKLELRERMFEASPVIGEYISMIEKNIWRKLEYKKALKSLMPWESLMDGLDQFYEILDTLGEFAEQQKDVNIEGLVSQINDVSSKLALVEELKK